MTNNPPNVSAEIKHFISLFTQCEADYKYHYDQVNKYDKEVQDILHSLELDSPTKNERNRLATKLQQNRKLRREHKNIAEMMCPVAEFLQSEKGKQIYNLLREVQGKTKKIEEYHANRVYIPRVKRGA
jgi:hypothetical protein